jgi:cyclase
VTLRRRLVVCLDVEGDRVVKGVGFERLRDAGDPVELAALYEAAGADEIVLLDVAASHERRGTLLDVVRRAAERLFVPLTVGGGVRVADDFGRALRAGADKVSVNSAAVARPELLAEAAARYGRQCVVASIDARREPGPVPEPGAAGDAPERRWRVFTHGGRLATELDAVAWARRCVELGAGEVLLTSIDRDGGRAGYELELTAAVAAAVDVPVVASGGAGRPEHVRDAFVAGGAAAALVAGILHDGSTTVAALKAAAHDAGVPMRRPQVDEILVDEEWAMMPVEGVMTADEPGHVVDPVRMIDQPLERWTGLVDLLVADAAVLGMILPMHVAIPAVAWNISGADFIDREITSCDFLGRQRGTQNHEALEIEEIFVECRRPGRAGTEQVRRRKGMTNVARGSGLG